MAYSACDAAKSIKENDSPRVAGDLAASELPCPRDQINVKLLPLRPAFCAWHGTEIYEASGCAKSKFYRCYGSKSFSESCETFDAKEPTVKDGEPCKPDR